MREAERVDRQFCPELIIDVWGIRGFTDVSCPKPAVRFLYETPEIALCLCVLWESLHAAAAVQKWLERWWKCEQCLPLQNRLPWCLQCQSKEFWAFCTDFCSGLPRSRLCCGPLQASMHYIPIPLPLTTHLDVCVGNNFSIFYTSKIFYSLELSWIPQNGGLPI